jgi:hypothetical protein
MFVGHMPCLSFVFLWFFRIRHEAVHVYPSLHRDSSCFRSLGPVLPKTDCLLVTSTTLSINNMLCTSAASRLFPFSTFSWGHYSIIITCLLSYSTFPASAMSVTVSQAYNARQVSANGQILLVEPLTDCMHACSPFFCVPCAPLQRTTSAYRRHWPMSSGLPDARRGGVVLNEVHLPAIRGFSAVVWAVSARARCTAISYACCMVYAMFAALHLSIVHGVASNPPAIQTRSGNYADSANSNIRLKRMVCSPVNSIFIRWPPSLIFLRSSNNQKLPRKKTKGETSA